MQTDDTVLPVRAFLTSVDRADLHWHAQMEFLLGLEGAANITVGENHYVLGPGDFILINSNQIHHFSQTEVPNVLLAVQIKPAFFVPIYPHWRELYFNCHSFFKEKVFARHDQTVRKYLALIVREINRRRAGYRARIGSNLYLLAYQLFNYPYYRLEDIKDETTDGDLKRLRRVVDYIDQNLHHRITLKEVGEAVHLSYHHLSRFIRDKLGISFQAYLSRLRLHKATELLLGSDKSIKQIAQEVGFSSATSFHRLFKREFNVTPGEYKDAAARRHIVFNPNMDDPAVREKVICDKDKPALKALFAFLETEDEEGSGAEEARVTSIQYVSIAVDARREGHENPFYRCRLTGLTTPTAVCGQNGRELSRRLKALRKVGFEQVRIPVRTDTAEEAAYDWAEIDQLCDALLQENLKPFMALGGSSGPFGMSGGGRPGWRPWFAIAGAATGPKKWPGGILKSAPIRGGNLTFTVPPHRR